MAFYVTHHRQPRFHKCLRIQDRGIADIRNCMSHDTAARKINCASSINQYHIPWNPIQSCTHNEIAWVMTIATNTSLLTLFDRHPWQEPKDLPLKEKWKDHHVTSTAFSGLQWDFADLLLRQALYFIAFMAFIAGADGWEDQPWFLVRLVVPPSFTSWLAFIAFMAFGMVKNWKGNLRKVWDSHKLLREKQNCASSMNQNHIPWNLIQSCTHNEIAWVMTIATISDPNQSSWPLALWRFSQDAARKTKLCIINKPLAKSSRFSRDSLRQVLRIIFTNHAISPDLFCSGSPDPWRGMSWASGRKCPDAHTSYI